MRFCHNRHVTTSSKMLLAATLPIVLLYRRGGLTDNDTVWCFTYLTPVIAGLLYAVVRIRPHEKGQRRA
jgi:hypothetical protein